MSTSLLKREELDVKSLKVVTEEKFVDEAKKLLGYDLLEDALALRKTAEVLIKLGIEPFNASRVDAYKKSKAESVHSRKTVGKEWNRTTITTRGVWETVNLKGYQREVPAFALVRAAAIKKALNSAKVDSHFQIEELRLVKTSRRHQPRPVADPFMVLVIGSTRLYIDVWDEPSFEGRRTK